MDEDTCEFCGKGPEDDVEVSEVIDPYIYEVWDDEVECVLCDECYEDRKQSV